MNKAITAALLRKRTALGGKQKGFTLIELLVVVLIIGVLSAIAIPIFLGQQEGAKDTAVAAQVTQVKTAMAVELAKGGTVAAAITKATGDGSGLDAYSASTDILIAVTTGGASGAAFTVTGSWLPGVASAATHGYTITDKTSAKKM